MRGKARASLKVAPIATAIISHWCSICPDSHMAYWTDPYRTRVLYRAKVYILFILGKKTSGWYSFRWVDNPWPMMSRVVPERRSDCRGNAIEKCWWIVLCKSITSIEVVYNSVSWNVIKRFSLIRANKASFVIS